MTDRALIMIVDDVAMNLDILETMLDSKYDIIRSSSGQECLEQLSSGALPDLILLDVVMPEMDGFEVCRQLSEQPNIRDIPILFATADESPDTKLRAFDIGVDAFITKPIAHDELLVKVEDSLSAPSKIKELKSMADLSQQAAMQAMIASSELGMLIQFMEYSGEISSYEVLGERLTEVAASFGVKAVFQFEYLAGQHNVGCREQSLEAKLMSVARSKARIFGQGRRVFFNQEHVSMLVKDMPVDDEALCGRLRDHFAVLMNATESVVRMINYEASLEMLRKNNIIEAADTCALKLKHVEQQLDDFDTKTADVLEHIHDEFNDNVFRLGLTEEQEDQLMALFNQGHEKMGTLLQEKKETVKKLNVVTEAIRDLA